MLQTYIRSLGRLFVAVEVVILDTWVAGWFRSLNSIDSSEILNYTLRICICLRDLLLSGIPFYDYVNIRAAAIILFRFITYQLGIVKYGIQLIGT
jgi:hypothetical protein